MNQKNLLKVSLAVVVCLGIFVTALPTDNVFAQAKEVRLKFGFPLAPGTTLGVILQEFCKTVEKRTAGKIKVDFYGGGSLVKSNQVYQGIVSGSVDMGYSHIEYTPGRFPVTAITQLPLGYPSAWVSNQVVTDFHDEFKPKEWKDVEVLWMHACPPSVLITTKPVRRLEDLSPLMIRGLGVVGKIVKALGATPAPTPVTEVYEAMSKGVIHGILIPYEAVNSFRFADVAKYITACWQTGSIYAFYILMNKNSYDKLPPGTKDIFDKTCGEYRERMALVWNATDFMGKEDALKNKAEIIELSPDQVVIWKKAVEPVVEEYVKQLVGAGHSEQEVRGWLKFLHERIDHWTKKQIEYRIPSPTGPEEMMKIAR